MRKLFIILTFCLCMVMPLKANTAGVIVNGLVASYGWYTFTKSNDDCKIYVGLTASIFTVRTIIQIFK